MLAEIFFASCTILQVKLLFLNPETKKDVFVFIVAKVSIFWTFLKFHSLKFHTKQKKKKQRKKDHTPKLTRILAQF